MDRTTLEHRAALVGGAQPITYLVLALAAAFAVAGQLAHIVLSRVGP